MMAVKIVVVGSVQLPFGVEFPPLEAPKYGWDQYPGLAGAELVERCWRAEIVVLLTSNIVVDRAMLEKVPRLQLLITVGDAAGRLDQGAAYEQGVELLAFPDALASETGGAQELCSRIVRAIDHYLGSLERRGGLS